MDRDGQPKDLVKTAIGLDLMPEIEQYPHRSPATVSLPWTASISATRNASLTISRTSGSPAGVAIVTVKTSAGVIARQSVIIPDSLTGSNPIDVGWRFPHNLVHPIHH